VLSYQPSDSIGALDELERRIRAALGDRVLSLVLDRGEATLELAPQDWEKASLVLRDDPQLCFEQLLDLCGIDYYDFGGAPREGPRYAAVAQLLSLRHNWRLRIRARCADDGLPLVPTLMPVWPSCGWYEREAFDLYGIVFEGHPDLRRILTDYGFIGHPFRRDFPISGTVEMRYDPELRRVVYQPVTIEPREVIPRVVREEGYAAGKAAK